MPLTSAQKSQRYRDKKIRTMGIKFKEDENRKRRERRARLKKEKKKMKTQQVQAVERIYKYITNEEFKGDLSLFKNTVRVMKAINNNPSWKKPNTRNKYLENLASVLNGNQDYEKAYKFYSKKSTQGRKNITDNENDNKLSESEKKNWVEQNIINNAYKSANSTYDKALIALYSLIPPRRRGLAVWLTLSKTKDFKKITNKNGHNWLLVSARGLPYKIVMYRYKTFKTYGVYTINLRGKTNKPLRDILKSHINQNRIEQGKPIFYNNKGDYLEPSNMSAYIQNTFNYILGKSISFNLLRHIKITDFYKTPKSINEKKKLAEKMGHDIGTQAKYARVKKR